MCRAKCQAMLKGSKWKNIIPNEMNTHSVPLLPLPPLSCLTLTFDVFALALFDLASTCTWLFVLTRFDWLLPELQLENLRSSTACRAIKAKQRNHNAFQQPMMSPCANWISSFSVEDLNMYFWELCKCAGRFEGCLYMVEPELANDPSNSHCSWVCVFPPVAMYTFLWWSKEVVGNPPTPKSIYSYLKWSKILFFNIN